MSVKHEMRRSGSDRRRVLALLLMGPVLGVAGLMLALAGLVTPPPRSEPPVDVFIERHVSVHTDVEPGAQVLISVNR